MTRRCLSCRMPIDFAAVRTHDGRTVTMPIHPTPDPLGEFEYLGGSMKRPLLKALDAQERLQRGEHDRYHSHWDDCPQAEIWKANPEFFLSGTRRQRRRRVQRWEERQRRRAEVVSS